MVNCVEGFTEVVVSNKTPEEKNEMLKILLVMILIKVFFIAIVAFYLWPYVMPKLFKGVTANPTFLQILALSVMVSMLL
tara:strand:+ start:609 stop:845 length:237 start_codon:yes stop_codon:yes gene_type:complete